MADGTSPEASVENADRPVASPPEGQREVEVKLSVSDAGMLDRLPDMLSEMGLTVGHIGRRIVRDVYVDTPDWWLRRAGVACRLRTVDDRTVLCLKTQAPVRDGMADRIELEEELPHPVTDVSGSLPGTRLNAWLAGSMPDGSVEVKFRLMQERSVYRVTASDGLSLCAYADRVRINDFHQFAELEFELEEGDPQELRQMGEDFRRRYALAPYTLSKFQRGLQAAGLHPPELIEGDDLAVRADDRFVDAAYRILRRHLGRFLWNEPGTRLGLDIEYLHDMRVAARRMRAALQVFHDALPPRRVRGLKRDLRWIGSALGKVRDLDVYLIHLRQVRQHIGPKYHPALEGYCGRIDARRGNAQAALLKAFDTARFARFVSRLRQFLDAGPPRSPSAASARKPVITAAPKLVKRSLKRVLDCGRELTASSPDAEFHAMRIRCKRTRYLCEFLSDLYGGPARKVALRVKALQAALGELQDAAVARGTVEHVAASAGAPRGRRRDLYLAMGQLVAVEQRRADEARGAFFKAWKKFDRKRVRKPLLKRLAKFTPDEE